MDLPKVVYLDDHVGVRIVESEGDNGGSYFVVEVSFKRDAMADRIWERIPSGDRYALLLERAMWALFEKYSWEVAGRPTRDLDFKGVE